jgi:hypothetical protein
MSRIVFVLTAGRVSVSKSENHTVDANSTDGTQVSMLSGPSV